MGELLWAWGQFTASALLVGAGGYLLCRDGEAVGRALGLAGGWIGLALTASVTSLPELATGISAVSVSAVPNIALGDALGSCVINLVFLVVADLVLRGEPMYRATSPSHVLSAAFGVLLIGFIGLNLLLAQVPGLHTPQLGHVGWYSPVLLALYLLALRMSWRYAHDEQAAAPAPPPWARFARAALLVALAGAWLPHAAAALADAMGWNRTFIGTLFVAGATSLPELAVTLAAIRVRALDMAVGNLLGSNLFNAAIVAVDDLFYRPGPLLSAVSPLHAITALCAVLMTSLALIGLFYRPLGRILRTVGWISVGLLLFYLFNAYVVFVHGD